MRIVVANKFWYRRGGLERVMFDEIGWLEQAGHQVAHFSTTHPENDASPWSAYFAPYLEIGPHGHLGPGGNALATARMFWNGAAARQFARLIDSFKPDVVHVHGIHRQLSPSILVVARRRGLAVVQSVHDHHPICAAGDLLQGGVHTCEPPCCGRFNVLPCVASRCVQASTVKSALAGAELLSRRWLAGYAALVDVFVSPSRYLASALARGGWQNVPMHVVANALAVSDRVPSPGHEKARLPLGHEQTYFAYTGRLSREKGLTTLLEAVQMAGVSLLVAGDGPQAADMRSRAPKGATFLGRLPGSAVDTLLAGCRAAVVPSECPENAPMAVLEPMGWGRPVIATRVGGIPEQLRGGVDGILVRPRDAVALAAALRLLGDDRELADRLGRSARLRVRARFSPESHLRGLERAYEAAAAHRAARECGPVSLRAESQR